MGMRERFESFLGHNPEEDQEPTPREQLETVEEELDAVLTQIESAKKEAKVGGGDPADKAAVKKNLEKAEKALAPKMEELHARRRELRQELGLPPEDTEEEEQPEAETMEKTG